MKLTKHSQTSSGYKEKLTEYKEAVDRNIADSLERERREQAQQQAKLQAVYEKSIQLMNDGKYIEALESFCTIRNYSNVPMMINRCIDTLKAAYNQEREQHETVLNECKRKIWGGSTLWKLFNWTSFLAHKDYKNETGDPPTDIITMFKVYIKSTTFILIDIVSFIVLVIGSKFCSNFDSIGLYFTFIFGAWAVTSGVTFNKFKRRYKHTVSEYYAVRNQINEIQRRINELEKYRR